MIAGRAIKRFQKILKSFGSYDLAIFHTFVKPPYGGGNQFLLAFKSELTKRGVRVETNHISKTTRACIFNSFNFDADELCYYKEKRAECLMVHRVDGPIGVYRGYDDGVDKRIERYNHEYADITIFQSRYSMEKQFELEMSFKNPVVIINASDPFIFNREGKTPFDSGRKTRLVSVSWSDNPMKGAWLYERLDEKLDFERYEYTFIGRTKAKFDNIKIIPPLDSFSLASELRKNDIYITASRNDPCSNSLIEAQSCGLPAVYHQSGGHPEIVGDGGLGFSDEEGAIESIEAVNADYERYANLISAPSIIDVAESYLRVMGFMKKPGLI